MGFFSKLAESMSTGVNATLSMRGVINGFNSETLRGIISYAGRS